MLNVISTIVDTVSSIATTASVIVALCIGNKELKQNNKLSLFEKRVKNYLTLKNIYDACDFNTAINEAINDKNDLHSIKILISSCILNNSITENVIESFYDIDDSGKHDELLRKISDIRNLADEAEFLFDNNEMISNFYRCYCDFIVCAYGIERAMKAQIDENKELHNTNVFDGSLMQNSFNDLKLKYNNLKDAHAAVDFDKIKCQLNVK